MSQHELTLSNALASDINTAVRSPCLIRRSTTVSVKPRMEMGSMDYVREYYRKPARPFHPMAMVR